MAVLVLLLAVVVALLGVLVAGLLRSHTEILRSLHELGVGWDPDAPPSGRAAPVDPPSTARDATDLVGETPAGDAISVGVVGVAHPTLVAFLTSSCTTCAGFWSAFADPNRLRMPGDARLVAVTKGPEAESAARLAKVAPPEVPVVMSTAAWADYAVPVAPYFAYVDGPSGAIVGEGASATWQQVGGMLAQALADAGMSRRRRRGSRNADRPDVADAQLRDARIEPGDPSRYPGANAGLRGDRGSGAPSTW